MPNSNSKNFEHEIIFHLLKEDSEKTKKLLLSKDALDWEYIFQIVEEHSIIPIIYKTISSKLAEFIPVETLKKFQNRYKSIAAFNFARSSQLIKIVNQLEKYDLPVIAYKGMTLAEFAYQDTSLRQFGDIDLFIRKKDFKEVKMRLLDIGCKEAWELSEDQEKAVLKYYYEYPFFYGGNKTLIEVHWEFVEPFFTFDYEIEEVWERTENVNLYGKDISTLSAEDYLIVLCSHGSKHFWKRLSWVCDVAKLIENKDIDWEIVIPRASKYGSLRMVGIGSYLANKICGTHLPDKITEYLSADSKIKPLGGSFIAKIFDEEKEPSQWAEMAKIHLKMREKFGTKLKYAYRLFTTKAMDSLFLPMGRPR